MKRQINKSILNLYIIILFSILLSCFVLSAPAFPHAVYGTALVGSSNVAAGTTISARIGNVSTFEMIEAGFYGNASADPHQYLVVSDGTNGDTITFYIGCAAATPTTIFSAGKVEQLNLAIASGTAYCGDGTCNGGESTGSLDSCTTSTNVCNTDCGATTTTTTTTSGGGGVSSGGAAAVAEAVTPTEVTDTTIVSDILKSIDPASIGLDSVSSDDVTVTVVQDTTTKTQLSVDMIISSLDLATSEQAKQALTEIQEAIDLGEVVSLSVKKSLIVYKVKSKTTGKSTTVSLITSEFTATKDGKNVRIIETIPKTMAESSDDITFVGLQPSSILQVDPIFEFDFAEVKAGDKKEIKYTINKKISEITSNTVAVYEESDEKPAVCGNSICESGETIDTCPQDCKVKKEQLAGWLIVGIVIVLGLILYFYWKKKKNKVIDNINDNFK